MLSNKVGVWKKLVRGKFCSQWMKMAKLTILMISLIHLGGLYMAVQNKM